MHQALEYLVNQKIKLYINILQIKDCGMEKYLYRKDIKLLRKELPTTTQYIFSEVKK